MDRKRNFIKFLNFLVILLLLIYSGAIPISSAQAGSPATRYVDATTGKDSGNCNSASSPCLTIQYAVNKASSGDKILVAAGVYTHGAASDPCPSWAHDVICYVDKYLTILGGYSTTDWSNANPSVNQTIIDGQNTYRGVVVLGYNTTTAFLDMEGFTIQNGQARGHSYVSSDLSGIGGGMWVLIATTTLKDMIFKNNQAIGLDNSSGDGGDSFGSALRIESSPKGSSSLLQNVVFNNNLSYGGSGTHRGGKAFGALFIYYSTVTIEDSAFNNNLAQGGNSSGNGTSKVDGSHADAVGGAIATECNVSQVDCYNNYIITLRHISITGNQVKGGNAGTIGGGAYGGGILVEFTDLFKMSDSFIADNTAIAGTAQTGGNAAGGAINATNSGEATFDRMQVINNTATGGNASTSGGNAGTGAGGGLYVFATKTGTFHATINNSFIADNQAYQGSIGVTSLGNGGGGGVIIQGMKVDINHATIARNHIGSNLVLGQGLVAEAWDASLPATVNLNYSIIANHTGGNTSSAAVVVDSTSTLTFNRGLFASNDRDTNQYKIPIAHGTINGLTTMLTASTAGFVSPGSPNYDYHILPTSPAKDQATGSTTPDDIDSQTRPYGPGYDIGADEYILPNLSATPNSFSEMMDNSSQATRNSMIGVSSGPAVSWTATTDATWLYLGASGTSNHATGQTGNNLIIRFDPGNVEFGHL